MKKSSPFKIIKNVIYYSIVAILLIFIVISYAIPGGLINVIGIGWYRVVSPSMEPIIRVNDFIVVKSKHDATGLVDGDIIVFETYLRNNKGKYEKIIVTHHFYKIDEEGKIWTYPHSKYDIPEEDRNPYDYDTWYQASGLEYIVTENDLVGIHINTIKTKGLIEFIGSPGGVIIIAVSILGITAISIFFNKNNNKDKEDNNDLE